MDYPTTCYVHRSSIDLAQIASKWLATFEASISDSETLLSLFHEHGFWKDILALTWDMRTIQGRPAIRRMLSTRLAATSLSAFHLAEDAIRAPKMTQPLPDLVFIRFCFEFETKHGKGIAVAHLVPTLDGTWVAWCLFTRLGALKAHPEKIGALRVRLAHDVDWEEQRRREIEFEDGDPIVLVIGAGHSGLGLAARLTSLGVSTLVIDRNQRIGDNWRKRYKALCLHDTVWRNQMPYLDFPKTWPVYCPASKLGDWLESYATALDLNVWLSSSITSASFSQEMGTWQISINRGGKMRTMVIKHLVFATGFGGGFANVPEIPGKAELYRGPVLHSTQFTSGEKYRGKKAIVVGACTSAHDIAHDLLLHGCQVTLIQRSPTYVISKEAMEITFGGMYNEDVPIEIADVFSVSLPFATQKHVMKGSIAHMSSGIDRELLGNLEKAGFRTWLGPDGAGFFSLVLQRGGGFYFDVGTSKEIIDGTIKVKGSPCIRRFTEGGVELDDGTGVEGDVVIFATGFGDMRQSIEGVCGSDVASKVGNVWGLDAEGELQGVWRRTGHPRLWITMSNLARSRMHSLHLALQIKAIEGGITQDGDIYSG